MPMLLDGVLKERFFDKIQPEPNSGCWLWDASTTKAGYGQFTARAYSKNPIYAHRFSYEIHKGKIPSGMHIDHLCNIRCCVNPDHLEVVSLAENNRRVAARGRHHNSRKTHCKYGHPLSGENLYIPPSGERDCRICSDEAGRRYRERRRNRECPSPSA